MKTYEKLARFIELNDDGLQSSLNTTLRKHTSLSFKTTKPNICKNMYMQRNKHHANK
jgi:hypothetical protein